MTKQLKTAVTLIGLLAIIFTTAFMLFQFSIVHGAIAAEGPTVTPNLYRQYNFFASSTVPSALATSTNATSTNIATFIDSAGRSDSGYMVIAGAKKVTLFFTTGGSFGAITSATGTFSVQVSPDGINWYNFNKLLQATGTTVSNIIEQSSATVVDPTTNTATSTLIYSMDLNAETYYAVRCVATIAGSLAGNNCSAFATF